MSTTSTEVADATDGGNAPSPDFIDDGESRLGEEIGVGSIGPEINNPQPWSVGTIYTDLETQTLIVDFAPPDPECIAGRATATIGRGGSILVSLSVDSDRPDQACPGGAHSNRIRVALSEPLADRRIYTSSEPDTAGASAPAEQVADSIIGRTTHDAIDEIVGAGLEVRDISGAAEVESDFNSNRINIVIENGVVAFAAVY